MRIVSWFGRHWKLLGSLAVVAALATACAHGSGGQSSKDLIKQALKDPATASVYHQITPCFNGSDPTTATGQATLVITIAKQADAVHKAHKAHTPPPANTIFTCFTSHLGLTAQQAPVFEQCEVAAVLSDVTISHRVVTFVFMQTPTCALQAKNGASSSPRASPTSTTTALTSKGDRYALVA